jgi:DNA repair exonuclease SbcCD nuclease subunit
MKFAHMADCHIGGWREPKLRALGYSAFEQAIDRCISEKVDFVIIAGDLFNTALPAVEGLTIAVRKFRELQLAGIPVYLIAGSHDYSPAGKSMIEVLEHTGLFVNVSKGERVGDKLRLKFAIDSKTGVKLTGILGKRAGLDKKIYEQLDFESLEGEEGEKIFLFHNLLTEFKSKALEKADSSPVSLLPKGFDYYAGGHVHIVEKRDFEGRKNVVYPGPLFPNSFSELEELKGGGFYIVNDGEMERISLNIKNVVNVLVNVDKMDVGLAEKKIREALVIDVQDSVVLLRVRGVLESGRPSDIKFREMFSDLYDKGAYFVMKNIVKLESKEFEAIKVEQGSVEEVEDRLIKEHLGQIKIKGDEEGLVKGLMGALSSEKFDGEKNADYEKRLRAEVSKLI